MGSRRVPKLCKHKRSGRGYVTDPATGLEVYLGVHGTRECDEAYERWRSEFLAREAVTPGLPAPGLQSVTIAQLAASYLSHAETYYRKNGRVTTEAGTIRQALAFLAPFADLAAEQFTPGRLKLARQAMLDANLERNHVNKQVGRIRRLFRWAVENEQVPVTVLQALEAVSPLMPGRHGIREEDPVPPVDLEVLEATLPHMLARDQALVLVHLASGARAEEIVTLRPVDIDRSQLPWRCEVRDEANKTAHLQQSRTVFFGPRARMALEPLLERVSAADGWLFPSRGRGHRAGYRGHLTVNGYRQAVESALQRANQARELQNAVLRVLREHPAGALIPYRLACLLGHTYVSKALRDALAGLLARQAVQQQEDGYCLDCTGGVPGELPPLPHWYPLQVRHRALTDVRARYGLEGAQAIGGHKEVETTQIYAEKSLELARRIAETMG